MANGKKPWTPQQINAAINAGVSVYRTGKQINSALRDAQRNATPRMHPRDFKGGRPRSGNKYPAKLGPLSVRKKVRMMTRTRRGFGAASSQSAGFLRSRRKSRKPKGWQAGRGITTTIESGGPLSADECLHVGHITGAKQQIQNIAWQSILKLLLQKMNIRLLELNSFMIGPLGFVVGDTFTFSYKADANATALSTTTYILVPASTFNDVVDAMVATFASANNAEIVPITFAYSSTTSKIYAQSITLESLMLHYQIKSSLKVQNRTVNVAGNDEADDVDNVPVYGKSIGGNGTGVVSRFPNSTTPAQVFGEVDSGIIRNVVLDPGALEPLSGYFWPKSSQEGKIHLDPGQIKTSVLSTTRNISLKYLYKLFATKNNTTGIIVPFGKYRFFQIERMIDAGTELPLLVAYEVNTNYNCYATTKYNWTTTPVFKKL